MDQLNKNQIQSLKRRIHKDIADDKLQQKSQLIHEFQERELEVTIDYKIYGAELVVKNRLTVYAQVMDLEIDPSLSEIEQVQVVGEIITEHFEEYLDRISIENKVDLEVGHICLADDLQDKLEEQRSQGVRKQLLELCQSNGLQPVEMIEVLNDTIEIIYNGFTNRMDLIEGAYDHVNANRWERNRNRATERRLNYIG